MENLLIEIKTKVDYETYRNFIRFLLHRGKRYKILFVTLCPILALLLLIMGIPIQDSIPLCVLMVIFIFLLSFMYFFLPRISYKKSKPMIPDETIYRFYENHIEGDYIGENAKSTGSYQYTVFKNVYEVKSAFYLRLMNSLVIIIPKRCLDAGQIDMLSRFFMYRFGEKYKNCH